MKIVIPELENPIVKKVIPQFPDIDFISTPDLDTAVNILKNGQADSMISGLDYSSRDVILSFKKYLPLKSKYFSSCFICQKEHQILAIADGGVNKLPGQDQFFCIVEDTAETFKTYTKTQPKIALLSYSTAGSGGKNPDLEKIHFVIEKIRKKHPDYLIDGEMQLDAAINPRVAAKKMPGSLVAGQANILITPDLNSGNILYKSLEQFAGWTCAGPIIQGFAIPLADLSRGSTTDDVKFTIDVIAKLIKEAK